MTLEAHRCPNGHLAHPRHPRCRECGESFQESVDLSDRRARIVTWTSSASPPPGVRSPNPVAIVEFDVDGEAVRAIGQLTKAEVSIGALVRPVFVEELRDPSASFRERASQEWSGYRFEPVSA